MFVSFLDSPETLELSELEIMEQIAEARYEVFRENNLPGLDQKEYELVAIRQRIAAIREAQTAREAEYLCTVHEVESPEEYDRYAVLKKTHVINICLLSYMCGLLFLYGFVIPYGVS